MIAGKFEGAHSIFQTDAVVTQEKLTTLRQAPGVSTMLIRLAERSAARALIAEVESA